MKHLKRALLTLGFAILVAAPVFTIAVPQTASAVVTLADCERRLLGMPTWFRGLSKTENGQCAVAGPGETIASGKTLDLAGFIWRIALNVIEIGLFIAGYVALFFILYGGFQFLTNGSNPSVVEKARMTLLNAVIGLAISMASIVIVNLLFGVFG